MLVGYLLAQSPVGPSPMKAIVTGSRGTVGAALCRALDEQRWQVARWDRERVNITDYAAMESFIAAERPDVLFHLAIASRPGATSNGPGESWQVNFDWTSELAWLTGQLGVRFVFASTVMVFTDRASGPYTIASQPNAEEGYGHEKRSAECRVFAQNPAAIVARLGWQIGHDRVGNQMVAWLHERRSIRASMRWIPACSFLEDTVAALVALAGRSPGLYHVDGNEGWSFFDIARALRTRHGTDWRIEPTWEFAHDQRLLDARLHLPALRERLPELLARPG